MRNGWALAALLLLLPAANAEPEKITKGEIEFATAAPEKVPEPFRLDKHTFKYELELRFDLPSSGVEVLKLRFPSPVKTTHEPNNTVHCEYFRPKSPGKHPAVIVLDILDGQQVVSRSQAMWLAQHDVAALVVYMAYYGPRRGPGCKERLLSTDIPKTVSNVTQTVLDCRRAVAWLEKQPEVDAEKLSLLGTSLGSLVGGVVSGAEPKLRSACLLLGGGGLVDAFTNHLILALIQPVLKFTGTSMEKLTKMIAPVDPLTYAENLKGKRLLLIAASKDDVVPPKAMTNLWEATGKPKIVWVDSTHVGATMYLFQMMREVTEHVKQ